MWNRIRILFRVHTMANSRYCRLTGCVMPKSYVIFGTDDAYWKKVERVAPIMLSVYSGLDGVVFWIGCNATGVWAVRPSTVRFKPWEERAFRHVFYFEKPNDALEFRMRFFLMIRRPPRG